VEQFFNWIWRSISYDIGAQLGWIFIGLIIVAAVALFSGIAGLFRRD
jgi:hypothetical protein